MSPGRNESPGGRTSVSEPTDESKSKHHNDEDFDKRNHDTIDV
jgi:hypothetical protein